jgi:hypothetical protein
MTPLANAAQWTIRIAGVLLLVLGIVIWTGHFDALIPIHLLLGVILVVALWTLAYLANRAGVSQALVMIAFAWGLLLPIVGVTQQQLLTGNAHWVVQVAHLVLGVVAIGLGEMLGAAMLKLGKVAGT